MIDPTAAPEAPHTIEAPIRYVVKGEATVFYPADRDKSYWPSEDHVMTITDVRPLKEQLSVEGNGFVLLEHHSKMTDYFDKQQIQDIFYPEMIELAKQVNGAVKAIAFGDVPRSDDPGVGESRHPSYAAHVDYGKKTVEEYVQRILGDEADYWLTKRMVLMNFWRPISTIYRCPLCLCDASTVLEDDLNDAEVRGGLDDPNRSPLWGYNLSYNPDHKWYYVPQMKPEEIYGFKLYDSDSSQVQWTGHTAIDDPETPEDAPPRQSMEIRTISFIED